MPRKCQVCNQPTEVRKAIDRDIVNGRSLPVISQEFGVSYDSVVNHAKSHITRQLAKACEIRAQNNGLDVLQELDDSISRVKRIIETAEEKKQNGLALVAIKELRGNLELVSKIQTFIITQQQKDEAHSPQFLEGREEMLQTIEENLNCLTDIERNIYFELLMKLTHGTTAPIEGINYPAHKPRIRRNRNTTTTDTAKVAYTADINVESEDDGLPTRVGQISTER